MRDEMFCDTGIEPTNILKYLYAKSQEEYTYYMSPAVPPVLRSDITGSLRDYLSNFINIPIADVGFLKTLPNSFYPIHKDCFRITALNMLMTQPSEEYITSVYKIDKNPLSNKKIKVPYQKDKFVILDVMSFHSVENNSSTITRLLLSIGIKTHSFSQVIDIYRSGKLFNLNLQYEA